MIVRIPWLVRLKGSLYGVEANATTIGPIIVLTEDVRLDTPEVLHEMIHLAQWRELYWVGFPIVFWVIYLYRVLKLRNLEIAYLGHPMEREAYRFMDTPGYIATRRPFAWAWLSIAP